jgi:translation initiation factor IF-2
VIIGHAEVRAVFNISKTGKIAGCVVRDGEIRRSAHLRVLRGGKKVVEGEISSLKHEKDDVRDVQKGFECGIGLRDWHEMQVGDILEAYTLESA